ncbi:MAG: Gfo/Idh/MocA family protein, partial [Candidatus Latescibacterota bacterium]
MGKSKPRLGFLGVGWIGLNRLEAVVRSGGAEIGAAADPSPEALDRAKLLAPGMVLCAGLDEMLDLDLDGIVIATPNSYHAEQTIRALGKGMAVFCQKPLGRSGDEVKSIVGAARKADRLLAVDLSYRFLAGAQKVRNEIRNGEIGKIFAVNLVFHNAYGPDKSWYYNLWESGGGCVFDLGIHLVDLGLWMLDFPLVTGCESRLFNQGKQLGGTADRNIEDYASARLDLKDGVIMNMECSWNLHAGRDAVIGVEFFGERGGLAV